MTEYEGYVCAPGDVGKIAIIVSRFNKSITDKLLDGALAKLRENMVSEDQITVVRVPGAFEIPTIAQRFALDEDYAAIICLGCVIKGETPHDEYINRAVSAEIARIGAEFELPVIFGLLTCNTVEQALARSGQIEVSKDKALGEQPGNKGAEAAEAALEMIDLMAKLPEIFDDEEQEYSSLGKNSEKYFHGDFDPVEVDPDSLQEIDDDDDEEENWFIRGGAERPNRSMTDFSKDRREKPSFNKKKGNSDFKTKRHNEHKFGERADKQYKKDGKKFHK